MNSFDGLQEWAKSFNTSKSIVEVMSNSQFFKELVQRSKAKKEESSNLTYISILLADCMQNGELIEESDGQFSGGYSVAAYRYNNEVIEFGYQDGKVCDMTRFYGELY